MPLDVFTQTIPGAGGFCAVVEAASAGLLFAVSARELVGLLVDADSVAADGFATGVLVVEGLLVVLAAVSFAAFFEDRFVVFAAVVVSAAAFSVFALLFFAVDSVLASEEAFSVLAFFVVEAVVLSASAFAFFDFFLVLVVVAVVEL
ncbi:MAG TPA: hypothetical protein VHX63_08155 [Acidobacteriaceae bacterium]|jgi:hypothetical protein|nr:hypothetical protein [Acidobacteriaceae bacterium]